MRIAWLHLLLCAASCRLHDSWLEAVPSIGSLDAAVIGTDAGAADAGPRDAAAQPDAEADAASACADLPEPLVAWIFDAAVDPGTPVPDRAASSPDVPLHAAARDPIGVAFLAGGVELSGGHLEAEPEDGRALGEALAAAGSLTIELWASTPHDDNTGPARIVTYSSGAWTRAFSILQNRAALETRLRTTATSENGSELGASIPAVFPAGAPRQIVLTYDGSTGRARAYVDGQLRDEHLHEDDLGQPAVLDWNVDRERLGCGDEFTDTLDQARYWRGTLHSVRVWGVALDQDQVGCRFAAP